MSWPLEIHLATPPRSFRSIFIHEGLLARRVFGDGAANASGLAGIQRSQPKLEVLLQMAACKLNARPSIARALHDAVSAINLLAMCDVASLMVSRPLETHLANPKCQSISRHSHALHPHWCLSGPHS